MIQQIARLNVGLSHVPKEEHTGGSDAPRWENLSSSTSTTAGVQYLCLRHVAWVGDGADEASSPVRGKTTRSMSDFSIVRPLRQCEVHMRSMRTSPPCYGACVIDRGRLAGCPAHVLDVQS